MVRYDTIRYESLTLAEKNAECDQLK